MNRPTRPIRVAEDLGQMIAWVADIEGVAIPDLVEPLLRRAIQERYERIRPAVEKIEAARAELAAELAAVLAPTLGGEAG